MVQLSSSVSLLRYLEAYIVIVYCLSKYFVDFILLCNKDNFSGVGPVNKLLDRWSDRYPDAKLHSIGVWDDIVTNR